MDGNESFSVVKKQSKTLTIYKIYKKDEVTVMPLIALVSCSLSDNYIYVTQTQEEPIRLVSRNCNISLLLIIK